MKQLSVCWTYFYEIWCLNIFKKSFEEIQVSLKSNKNNGNLHEDICGNSKGTYFTSKVSLGLPQQAEVAQGVPGRLSPRIFLTFRH